MIAHLLRFLSGRRGHPVARKLESVFQRQLKAKLESLFPGCVILKNDPTYLQGVPDLVILYGNRWAMLEVKRSAKEAAQPNQEYYVERFGEMSFCAFISPDNEEEVLHDLQLAFRARRNARISQRK